MPDPGLAVERTRLAWRRTLLSFLVASLVSARQLWSAAGAVALVPLCCTLVCSVLIGSAAKRRGRMPRPSPGGGAVLLAFAVACSASALSALAVILALRL
jgi:putative membrane protein